MSLKGIRGTLTDFLGAGGHISVGISKAIGYTQDIIDSYISKHIINPSVGTFDRIMNIANDGIFAANANNNIPSNQTILLENVPIVPEQYGEDTEGRRITTAILYGETEDDPGKLIRIDFETDYTRELMELRIQDILLRWIDESPEAFTGGISPEINAESIREVFTSRKY